MMVLGPCNAAESNPTVTTFAFVQRIFAHFKHQATQEHVD